MKLLISEYEATDFVSQHQPDALIFVNELILLPRMTLNASADLHQSMLHSIMRSRVSFFEATPLGRILNRFSRDVNAVELTIPRTYTEATFCGLDVLAILAVVSLSTPYILGALVPLMAAYAAIQRLYVASCR